MHRDLALGGTMLALSAGYYWMAAAIPTSQLADAVGPQGLPRVYALLLGVVSLALIVTALRKRTQMPTTPGASDARPTDSAGSRPPVIRPTSPLWRVAGMLAIGVVYILVAPWLGYLFSIAAVILATVYYQGGALGRQAGAVALSGGIVLWLLFVVLMRVAQPPGWWPPLP
ncbi:MAG: tripartite tricarboxylate transporter TctB family protein [Acidobacteria bacterium]|nr:tripartite tricarboxylate transporter TctB family protein [Acidobacteriota bacterium]